MGNHIATAQTHRRRLEPPPPPEVCQNFTCEICIEPTERVAQTFRQKNATCAAHRFCNNCMIKYIEAKLDDNIPKIPCPAPTCPEFLDPLEYRALVGTRLFVRWCDALCELALVGVEKSYCPNRSCSAVVVNECRGATVKRAACPGCKTAFCFQCKLPWHPGFPCGEFRDQNDCVFGVLVEEMGWMCCPQCNHVVERIYGCDQIRCRCGAYFCYKCGIQNGEFCHCTGPTELPAGCCCSCFIFLLVLLSLFLSLFTLCYVGKMC